MMKMIIPSNFTDWKTETQHICEQSLCQWIPSDHENLHQAMRYSVLGGKRVRAMLVRAASCLNHCDLNAVKQAMAAVECIHAYSLIHDDLPMMDDDNMRRGKPSCHIAFGEGEALLAGDALQALAFEILTKDNNLPDEYRLKSIKILAQSSGSLGMVGGQSIDCAQVGHILSQSELEKMHSMKTGALIEASVLLGYYCCFEVDNEVEKQLKSYAQNVGKAFQVVDDILDATADSTQLGKTAGKDAEHHKPTFVSLMGIENAREYAHQLYCNALKSIDLFNNSADFLRYLSHFIIGRTY